MALRNSLNSWCNFISTCDVILLITSAFDCAYGVGLYSFTYLFMCILEYHFDFVHAVVFVTPTWMSIVISPFYDKLLDGRVTGNTQIAMYLLGVPGYPNYLMERSSYADKADIIASLVIGFCNFHMSSKVFGSRTGFSLEHLWKYQLLLMVPILHFASHHLFFCMNGQHSHDEGTIECEFVLSIVTNMIKNNVILLRDLLNDLGFGPYQFSMENSLFRVKEITRYINLFCKALGAFLFLLVILRCMNEFGINMRLLLHLKNSFLTRIIYPWWDFVSTCDVIMLSTSAFDCAFGIGAYNSTYLLFCSLKQSLAFLILIPGWMVVFYVLGYKYFLERVIGNIEIAKFFLHIDKKCPNYLVERGKSDEVFDVKLSLAIVFCNLMASKFSAARFGPSFKHLWKYRLILTVPFFQLTSQFFGHCIIMPLKALLGEDIDDHPEEESSMCLSLVTFVTKLASHILDVSNYLLWIIGFDPYSDDHYFDFETRQKSTVNVVYYVLIPGIALNILCLFVGITIFLVSGSRILQKLIINLVLPWNLLLGINFRQPLNLLLGSISRFSRDIFADIRFNSIRYEPRVMPNHNQENNEYGPDHHISAAADSGELVEPDEKDSIIAVLKEFQSETLNQQKKLENELKEGLKKFLHSHLGEKLATLETELKRSQVQQFADMKNQQKLFLQRMQNNSKKKEELNSMFDEIKEDSKRNFDHQSKISDKQYEGLRKQCNEMKTTITNQTRQIGILHNLVLELKNSDGESDSAKAQGPQLENRDETSYSRECPICFDKEMKVALRNCGHLLCFDCAKKYPRKCPTCSKVIIGTQEIFLP